MDLRASKNELTGRWTLHGVEPSEKTFADMCKMLELGINFKFARYGDGEFFCMSGKIGHNCDKHEYFPELGIALNNAFRDDPDYMVGIQPLSVSGGLFQKIDYVPKNIYDADTLHSASIDGKLDLFIDAFKDRNVILIGPKHLVGFGGIYKHILIPNLNCWNDYDRVSYEMDSLFKPDCVFLLCASMMSEVLIDDFRYHKCTMVDCGSVFEPYVNRMTRSYHYKLKINSN